MEQSQTLVVAAKDEVFDTLFRKTALIATLAKGSAAEAEYEAMDAGINRQIVEVGRGLFRHEFADKHIFVSDSWWPDHTRHVDVSIDGFTQAYYDGLRTVLAAAPSGWRVQAVVYGDIRNGKTMIGSAAIWADRVLVDRALYGLLAWRRIDLRCASEPVWREAPDQEASIGLRGRNQRSSRLTVWISFLVIVASAAVLHWRAPEEAEGGGACALMGFGLLVLLLIGTAIEVMTTKKRRHGFDVLSVNKKPPT